MSVKEFLATHSSTEITEYLAYDKAFGPIGGGYEREALAALHEQMQLVMLAIFAQNVEDEDDISEIVIVEDPETGKRKKVRRPKINRYPRPGDSLKQGADDGDDHES